MSTVDSYSFLAASTFGNDIMGRLFKLGDKSIVFYTRLGLVLSSALAVVLALFFRSVVDIWHVFGSIGTPALLVPVFSSFVGSRRLPAQYALLSIALSGGLSLAWYVYGYVRENKLVMDLAIFPGLACSLVLYLLFAEKRA